MVSAAVTGESGKLLCGQSLQAFCASALGTFTNGYAPWAIGLNCSLNAEKLFPFVKLLSETADMVCLGGNSAEPCLVAAYPNAGLPNNFGRYEETPKTMAANMEKYFKEGLVNIAGGCCGSVPAHTVEIAKTASSHKPRRAQTLKGKIFLAGLELFEFADNAVDINDADENKEREEFLKLLNDGESEDAVDAARDMVDGGLSILNVKTDKEKNLESFLDFALMNPYVAKVPFYINSNDTKTLQTGLKRMQGKGLAGPVSLKEGEEKFLRDIELIKRYGAAAVIKFDQKTENKQAIFDLLHKNGLTALQINCPGLLIAL
jgi:5-methyltetrahydrofolate--homocysteine methyltransferase